MASGRREGPPAWLDRVVDVRLIFAILGRLRDVAGDASSLIDGD